MSFLQWSAVLALVLDGLQLTDGGTGWFSTVHNHVLIEAKGEERGEQGPHLISESLRIPYF
jgi:hypothetical protein